MTNRFHGVSLECIRGDITDQPDMDAIVNAANAQLRTGGGVAGAIHRAAGPGLEKECQPLAPIKPGEAVITRAHELPNRHVIHCLGPVYGTDKPENELLASCYRQALQLAEQNDVASIAFPALSTGAFGYPKEDAAKVAMATVLDALPTLKCVKRIRFALFSDEDVDIHQRVLNQLAPTN
ncbi:macro domain-containing protein [Marinimicrobium sp. ABcell2]|uniref:macro domain-containing protein n=1 Tax=Marinimicrobium sp. ABcell2 TaxID=3069751 RepID=UPI0027B32AE4|nr:macro domain-containing protein [Marinimicrobium sp. ABcell2]MDQ2078372.1 macro domain-containing protein [Marinimicrobium sp. ABcell2]